MKRYHTLARHILDAIARIEEYTKNVDKNEFMSNFMIQDAVMRQLEIIGEASRQIPSPVKEKFPDIPWRDINGMRNKLIHEYFSVDIETVWNIVRLDLQDLKNYATMIFNFDID